MALRDLKTSATQAIVAKHNHIILRGEVIAMKKKLCIYIFFQALDSSAAFVFIPYGKMLIWKDVIEWIVVSASVSYSEGCEFKPHVGHIYT